MNTVLVVLVLVSLATAIVCGVIAWRALDDRRRRSAARVAALTDAIHAGEPSAPVAVADLFEKESGAMMAGRPLIKAAVAAALGIALVVFVATATSRGPVNRDARITASQSESSAALPGGALLELITMRHDRVGDALTITGLVRNPASGSTVARVNAVILAFDRDGTFIASAQAPLDFTTLGPGDESPFVVTVPRATDVGRYRVSFRTEAGLIRHVDRRAAPAADDARGAAGANRRAQVARVN